MDPKHRVIIPSLNPSFCLLTEPLLDIFLLSWDRLHTRRSAIFPYYDDANFLFLSITRFHINEVLRSEAGLNGSEEKVTGESALLVFELSAVTCSRI